MDAGRKALADPQSQPEHAPIRLANYEPEHLASIPPVARLVPPPTRVHEPSPSVSASYWLVSTMQQASISSRSWQRTKDPSYLTPPRHCASVYNGRWPTRALELKDTGPMAGLGGQAGRGCASSPERSPRRTHSRVRPGCLSRIWSLCALCRARTRAGRRV
jgi:hypothetical protein